MSSLKIHETAIVHKNAQLADNVEIGPYSIVNENVVLGENTRIGAYCIIGEKTDLASGPTIIGKNSTIRSGSVIYECVEAKERLETGPKVFIRENTKLGVNFRIGTISDIEGDACFGDYVRLHSNVHVGKGSNVGNFVWLFPYVVITNDPHPPSEVLAGVTIRDFAVVATSSVLLPGVTIGEGALVGAMSLVRKDVNANTVVVGNPAKEICQTSEIKFKDNPSKSVYPWPYSFDRGMPWAGLGFDNWLKVK